MKTRTLHISALLACSLLLAACGDSSDNLATNADIPISTGADPDAGTDTPSTESEPVTDAGSSPGGEGAGDTAGTDGTATTPGLVDDDSATDTAGASPTPVEPGSASDPAVTPGADSESAVSPADVASDSVDGGGTDIAPVSSEPSPTPLPPPQSGILTAGDYDDQLNPWLYQSFSNNYLQNVRPQQNIPRLDLNQRVAVSVKGSNGMPYAGASVSVMNEQGNRLASVVTPANGTTYLYRDIDSLSDEFVISVEDRFGDVAVEHKLTLGDSQQQAYEVELPTIHVPYNMLDLQLVIDTTGSMGDELAYIQAELSSIINSVQQTHPQVSIHAGLVVYRDHGDQYVVRSYPFTNDLVDLQNSLNSETFDGGGDYPEAMDVALREAMQFQWREQSAKLSLLIADAPPHSDKVNPTWSSALDARSRQIHIVPVAASGVAQDAEYLMRSMAALTNSRYLFLTDDSGVGNPHEEPAIDCYIVTRLDGLIKRVVDHVITGIRSEPSHNEIIRQVGNYDNGVCRDEPAQQ
jgi:hypothetical protein